MIIGLSGYARSGKDTVAGMLIGLHGYDNRAFADGVRQFLVHLNPILEDGHRLNEVIRDYGWEYTKGRTEVRRLLQELGLGVRDFFGTTCWIDRAMIAVSYTHLTLPTNREV